MSDLQDEEEVAARRMAHLVGICPKCGDAGTWLDDANKCWRYCSCPIGIKLQAEDEGGGD